MLQEVVGEIEKSIRAMVNEVHTALPGRIISYNASKGTASIQPIGKFRTPKGKVLDYPVVSEVPVVFPYCYRADVGIAFPVVKGDTCLIVVSEIELDEWRSGATSEGSLHFDLSSAIAIPGLLRSGNKMTTKASEKRAVIIGAPGTEVCVSSDGVEIGVGEVTFAISESGIAIGGNLIVEGDISYTGTLNVAEKGDNEVGSEEV